MMGMKKISHAQFERAGIQPWGNRVDEGFQYVLYVENRIIKRSKYPNTIRKRMRQLTREELQSCRVEQHQV